MKTKITITLMLFMLGIIGVNAQIKKSYKYTPVKINRVTPVKTNSKIKATFVAPNGKHYFFTEKRYFRYSKANGLEKIANSQPNNWSGIPENVDAAFVNPKNKKAYFFKGSKYYRWDFKKGLDNPELAISRFWKGVPSNVDAVVAHPNGKIYFFKDSEYFRYNPITKKVDKKALIRVNWKGVPNNVDAVLLHANGKIYFFKGNTYYRYNIKTRTVDKTATVGKDGWRGLDFNKKNFTKKPPKKTKLKITLTGMKVVRLSRKKKYNFLGIIFQQSVTFKAKGSYVADISNKRDFNKLSTATYNENKSLEKSNGENSRVIIWQRKNTRFNRNMIFRGRSGDYFQINNSLVYALTPKEMTDKKAYIKVNTYLRGSYSNDNGFAGAIKIAEMSLIDIQINEILNYLLNPKGIPTNYFNSDGYHYSGADGTVMPFKIAKDRSALDGYVENSNNGVTIRTYFHFELIP